MNTCTTCTTEICGSLASAGQVRTSVLCQYHFCVRPLHAGLTDPERLCSTGTVQLIPRLGYDDFSPSSTPSDSEPEDEADEDSNDEDFYRNDYPEDEDADEDMEGYEDAFANEEDADYYSDEVGSDREPGTWDYR